MSHSPHYQSSAPTRAEIDALPGATLLQFGTDWCTHCQAAREIVSDALAAHPRVRHLQVEDGKGRPLGRSFAVKLWPTLIFLRDGREVERLVRPADSAAVRRALAGIDRDA